MTGSEPPVDDRRGKVPLLITAELPGDVLAWADALRRAHYPPERNRLRAHVTLFHALPPAAEEEIRALLADLSAAPPPAARISGLMKLGDGTALAIDSPGTVALHGAIAGRLHGLLTRQDAQPLRLHITIQAKVKAAEATAPSGRACAPACPPALPVQGPWPLWLARWSVEPGARIPLSRGGLIAPAKTPQTRG